MPTLARRQAFLSTFALTALLIAVPLASASATTSGLDTPPGVASLPLAVEGTAVMTLTPGVATVDGSLGIGMASPGSLLQVNGGTAIGFATSTAAPTNGLTVEGNVGIGVTSPGSPLQVNGGTAIGYSTSTVAPANGLAVNGKVGIGVTSPAYQLDVQGSGGTIHGSGRFYSGAAGTGGIWVDGGTSQFVGSQSGASMGFYNNGWNLLLDNSGNLTVAGTVTVEGSTITNATVNVANALLNPSCGSNEALTENPNHTFACVTIANLAQIGPATVPNCAGLVPPEALTWNGTGFSCVATAVTPPASLWTALSGNIYNTSLAGNVGINMSNPAIPLDVVGQLAAQSDAALDGFVEFWGDNAVIWKSGNGNGGLRFGNAINLAAGGWSEKMRIADNGNVGINTTAPGTTLEVNGAITSDRNWIYLAGAGDTNHAIGNLLNVNGNDAEQFRFWGFLDFLAAQTGNSAIRILNNGNVGVNTITPATTLDVNGTIRAAQQTSGAGCSTVGAIGHDASGNLLTCGSTGVWAAAGGGATTGWVVVQPTLCSSTSSSGTGSICITSTAPAQICANAGYADFTGNCAAVDGSGRPVQGTLIAWESSAPNWQMACSCSLGGFCTAAWGMQIQCTH